MKKGNLFENEIPESNFCEGAASMISTAIGIHNLGFKSVNFCKSKTNHLPKTGGIFFLLTGKSQENAFGKCHLTEE